MTKRLPHASALLATVALLGLGACTAILGDFTTSDAVGSDGGPGSDGSPPGDGDIAGDGAPAPGTFAFSAPASVFVRAGATATVAITVTRNAFTAPIVVTPSALPAGVTAPPITIAASASTGTLTLTAAASAVVGVEAKASLAAAGGTVTAPAAAIAVTISGPTGTLDTTFPATPPFTSAAPDGGAIENGILRSAAAQPDGKVILFGTFHATVGDAPGLIMRMNEDGTRDTTFPTNAIATNAAASPLATGVAGLVQADGKFIVAWTEGANSNLNVTRLLATGALDPSWHDPTKATVSTSEAFTVTSPQVTALTEDKDGNVMYGQPGSSTSALIWRFTSSGILDPTIGPAGAPGMSQVGVGSPADSVVTLQSVLPQSDGTAYLIGWGEGQAGHFEQQVLGRATAHLAADTTFGPSGAALGWEAGWRFYNNMYESTMIGSTIYTGTEYSASPCISTVDFCVTSWTVSATDGTIGGQACPDPSTGLGCSDQAVRITQGAGGTLLVAGFTVAGGNLPVVARFKTGPLAVDTTFGTTGVTKLKAATSSAATETPVAVLAMPNGSTLVFNQDTVNPIQRVWP